MSDHVGKEELKTQRAQLARAEYLNKYMLTCSFVEAEKAYRNTLGSLAAEVPPDLEAEAIALRGGMLERLKPEILGVKRQEYKELQLLHAHIRRLILVGDVAETGTPDDFKLEDLRQIEAEDLTTLINGVRKLQEMRRDILSS